MFAFVVSLALCLQSSPLLPGEEGDLANRSFLPKISAAAELHLKEFESNLAASKPAEAALALARLLESADAEAELVAVDSRLSIGLREWLELRLAGASQTETACYALAVGELARIALANAGNEIEALRELAKNYPSSPAAREALLRLGDFSFEKGEFAQAAGFYHRLHDDRGHPRIRRMESMNQHPRLRVAPTGSWSAIIEKESENFSRAVLPQATDRSLLLQTGKFLYEFDANGRRLLSFDLDRSVFDRELVLRGGDNEDNPKKPTPLCLQWIDRNESPWDGEAVFLAHSAGNKPPFARALTGIRLTGKDASRRAEIVWQRGWSGEETSDLADLVLSERFLVEGRRIYLLAQKARGEASNYAICLDAGSGQLLWKRFLTKGAPIEDRQESRLKIDRPSPPPDTTPVSFPGVIVFASNAGILAALDADRGAYLWALRTHRSQEDARRQSGARLSRNGDRAIYSPEDSSWLYCIRPRIEAASNFTANALFVNVPWHAKGLREFLGVSNAWQLFLEGREDSIRFVAREPVSGKIAPGPWMPRGEEFVDFRIENERLLFQTNRALRTFEATPPWQTKTETFADAFPDHDTKSPMRGFLPLPSGVAFLVSDRLHFLPEAALKKE